MWLNLPVFVAIPSNLGFYPKFHNFVPLLFYQEED
jgi:hypothetical protein